MKILFHTSAPPEIVHVNCLLCILSYKYIYNYTHLHIYTVFFLIYEYYLNFTLLWILTFVFHSTTYHRHP